MSTSPHEGVYLYDPAEFGADRFVDTALVRDGVINSALHKADSAAQPRGIWTAPVTALWTDDSDPWLVPRPVDFAGSLVVDQWFRFPVAAIYVPKVRASGQAYRLRITIGGRSSAGHSCDFAVLVAAAAASPADGDPAFGTWPQKTYSNVTSTTVATITADDATRILDPSLALTEQALERSTWSTLTDIGGDSIALRAPLLEISVYGRTANLSSNPELHLFGFQEVIGT